MRPGTTNKIYVGMLSGEPKLERAAFVYEIDLDEFHLPLEESIRSVAGPFWAIVDMEFHDANTLYVLEASPGGLVSIFGRLTRVNMINQKIEIVAEEDELFFPAGVAVDGDKIYVTNNAFSKDRCGGHVVVASLPQPSTGAMKNVIWAFLVACSLAIVSL